MTEEREVIIEGTVHTVIISDEKEALLAAKAAGRALIGVQSRENMDLWPASYVAESWEDLDDAYLEQVVRRHLGLPWYIGETKRLLIREFQAEDAKKVPGEETDREEDSVFYTPDKLSRYIRCQYGFYEYGLWALVEKKTGNLAGKAGIVRTSYGKKPWEEDRKISESHSLPAKEKPEEGFYVEIGYHIFRPFRRRGYATESCRKIVELVREKAEMPVCIYAKIDASNKASIGVAKSCGFFVIAEKCSGEVRWLYLCSDCW